MKGFHSILVNETWQALGWECLSTSLSKLSEADAKRDSQPEQLCLHGIYVRASASHSWDGSQPAGSVYKMNMGEEMGKSLVSWLCWIIQTVFYLNLWTLLSKITNASKRMIFFKVTHNHKYKRVDIPTNLQFFKLQTQMWFYVVIWFYACFCALQGLGLGRQREKWEEKGRN